MWGGAGEKGRGEPACVSRWEGWLTLFLLPEPREFQASSLLLPAPTQVPQPAGRVASLLECHAIQLCQHTGRDHPGDKDWVHRASRLPTQVHPMLGFLLIVAPILSPIGPLPLFFPHFVPLFHRLPSACIYPALHWQDHWSQKGCGSWINQYPCSESQFPVLRHG